MKRLTVNTFALQSLRKRKKQYAALVAGIILAMVFSSGTLFLLSSLFAGIDDLTDQAFGKETAVFYGLTEETLADGQARFHIEYAAKGEILGYLMTEEEDRGVSVAKLTPEARELTYTVVTDGDYPQNAGEIAIEEDALIRMGLHARPGDTVTFTLQVQNDADYLPTTVQKSYLLSGILKDRRVNVEYMRASKSLFPAAFVSDKEMVEPGGKPLPVAYAVFSRGSSPTNSSYQFYYDFCKAHEEINNTVESVFIARDSYSLSGIGKLQQSGVLASVLAAVFTVVSCVGIVNAFSSDLQDRKKQIGMLRALGATKTQIVRIFGREAFLIALCSTPFSLLLSYFGTLLAVRLIGNGLRFLPDYGVLFGGVGVSLLCVMATSLIPLAKTARISPMQAVRDVDKTRVLRRRKLKSEKRFSVPRLIAKRKAAFSPFSRIFVCVILAISVALSALGVSYIAEAYNEALPGGADYRIYRRGWEGDHFVNLDVASRGYGLTDNDVQTLSLSPYTDKIRKEQEAQAVWITDEPSDYLTMLDAGHVFAELRGATPEISAENWRGLLTDVDETKKDFLSAFSYKNAVSAGFSARDEESIRRLEPFVTEGKIDIDKLNAGEEILLAAPDSVSLEAKLETLPDGTRYLGFSADTGVYSGMDGENVERFPLGRAERSCHAGDTVRVALIFNDFHDSEGTPVDKRYTDCRVFEKEIKIGAVLSIPPGGIWTRGDMFGISQLNFISTHAGKRAFGVENRYVHVDLELNTPCTDEIDEQMMRMISPMISGTSFACASQYKDAEEDRQMLAAVFTGLMSVVLLFFTVAGSMICTSLTADIRANRRQIGTLRAVGASLRELTDTYLFRLLLPFGVGVPAGAALAAVVWFVIFKFAGEKIPPVLWPTALLTLALFGACCLNLYIQLRKLTKTSIVENIREL